MLLWVQITAMCGGDGAEFGGVENITLHSTFHHYLHPSQHTLALTLTHAHTLSHTCTTTTTTSFDLTSHWSSLLPCQIFRLHLAGLTKITMEKWFYLFNFHIRSQCQCSCERMIPNSQWRGRPAPVQKKKKGKKKPGILLSFQNFLTLFLMRWTSADRFLRKWH